MSNWKRRNELDGDAIKNYHMVNGIWGIANDYDFELPKFARAHLVKLYKILMAYSLQGDITAIETSMDDKEKTIYQADANRLLKYYEQYIKGGRK